MRPLAARGVVHRVHRIMNLFRVILSFASKMKEYVGCDEPAVNCAHYTSLERDAWRVSLSYYRCCSNISKVKIYLFRAAPRTIIFPYIYIIFFAAKKHTNAASQLKTVSKRNNPRTRFDSVVELVGVVHLFVSLINCLSLVHDFRFFVANFCVTYASLFHPVHAGTVHQ